MFVDLFTQIAAAQAFTSGTTIMTNTVDLSAIDPDIGVGEPFGLQITVDVAADFTTMDETYQIEIVNDDSADLSSSVSIAIFPILAANLAAGDKHFLMMPAGTLGERFLGAEAVLAGTTPTVTLSAHFAPQSMGESTYRNYAIGYTIS